MELSEIRGHLLLKDRGYAEYGYLLMLPFTVFKKQVKMEHTYRAVVLKLHGTKGLCKRGQWRERPARDREVERARISDPLLGFNHSCSVHLFYIFGFCFINV